jgi:hypothetical protein
MNIFGHDIHPFWYEAASQQEDQKVLPLCYLKPYHTPALQERTNCSQTSRMFYIVSIIHTTGLYWGTLVFF